MESAPVSAVIAWLVLHVGALAFAWGTRVVAGSRLEVAMQSGFFAIMAAVGASAWVCREIDIEIWPASGVTLMAMVVMAVIDLRRLGESVAAAGSPSTR